MTQFTDAEMSEEWDLPGLVAQMHALYGTDITVDELREEIDVESRNALVDEFVGDALDAYAEREESFTPELMREIERYVILQIVDTRWREHLESMDYLREGVHLRAMAQKDPLVEYRGEGHAMFEDLGRAIREEVVLTVFHVEVERDEAERQLQPVAAPRRSHTSTSSCRAPTRSQRRAAALPPRSLRRPRRRRWARPRRSSTSTATSGATTRAGAARARSTNAVTARRRRPRSGASERARRPWCSPGEGCEPSA